MSKRPRRPRRARKSANLTMAAAPAVACKLRAMPGLPDFEATAGETVRLFTHDHVGAVLIAKAEYAGKQLVPAGQAIASIELDVLPNRNTLKLVFVFSASITGQGELREDCGGDSQFIRPLHGDEPLQLVRIIGR